MQIWVDADACPKKIKEILYKAVIRNKIELIMVANQPLFVPNSCFIKKIQVPAGFDVADNYIVQHLHAGDLVITADVPLADAVVTHQGTALNPRGELYSEHNIKKHLSMRNFSTDLRSSGIITRGPPSLSTKEVRCFANALDRFLANNVNT